MTIKRGEIYYIQSYGNECGSEQRAGRPAIIVSNDKGNQSSSTVEVVYLTTQLKHDLPTHVVIRATGKESIALCEQVHTVAVERVGDYCGECSKNEMQSVDIALLVSLSLDNFGTAEKAVERTAPPCGACGSSSRNGEETSGDRSSSLTAPDDVHRPAPADYSEVMR